MKGNWITVCNERDLDGGLSNDSNPLAFSLRTGAVRAFLFDVIPE